MAIIQSCCFWKSLRKGSFASATYSFVSRKRLILNRYLNSTSIFICSRLVDHETTENKISRTWKKKRFKMWKRNNFWDVHTIYVYLQIYFFISSVTISLYLYEERDYLTGKVDKPTSISFLGASPCKSMNSFGWILNFEVMLHELSLKKRDMHVFEQ